MERRSIIMARYELSDQVVNNIRALVVKAPITYENGAQAVNEVLIALSKPLPEENTKSVP